MSYKKGKKFKMKVIIAAAGTGGHINPGLAIANKIKEEEKEMINNVFEFNDTTAAKQNGKSQAAGGTATDINQEVTDVGTMSIHVGANENQVIVLDIPKITTYTIGTDNINVMTSYTAQLSIGYVDEAINYVNSARSKLGAYENRFDHTTKNLEVSSENVTKALSAKIDTDMAEEMTEYTSQTVLTQAATSILSQANQRPSEVLQLLQN